jgi:peptide/nickel transport system substrate-binding protein
MSERVALIGLIMVLVVGATACGSTGGSSTTSRLVDTNATLKLRATVDPNSMDPPQNNATYGPFFLNAVYENLIKQNADGSYAPLLALDWAYVDNNTALQMHTRKGVTFTDGTPFNAAAVKANIDRAKTIRASTTGSELVSITSTEVVDDSTVKFNLAPGRGGTLLDSLAYKPGLMVSPAAFARPDLASNPVGTGPFMLTGWRKGVSLTYDRNPNYWAKRPAVAHLELDIMLDEQAATNALKTGQISGMAGSWAPSGPLLADLKQTAGIVTKPAPGNDVLDLSFNMTVKGFEDVRVRQAISFAVDRDALIKSLGSGRPDEQMAPPNSRYYNPKYKGYYKYNPDKAKQLLSEAGYAAGFSFEIITNTTSTENMQVLQIMQQQFQKVGISMKIRPLESSAILPQCFVQLKCDTVIGNYTNRSDTAAAMQQWFAPNAVINTGRPLPGGGRETPAALAQLMKLADQPSADAEHVKRVQELVGANVADADLLIWYAKTPVSVTRSNVELPWLVNGYADYANAVVYKV